MKLLHEVAKSQPREWSQIEAKVFVGDSLYGSAVTDREKLRPGVNLLDGIADSGGWTSFGSEEVIEVDGDTVKTTAGNLSPEHRCIYYDVKNIMPYSDGDIRISLFSPLTDVIVPPINGKPERRFIIDTRVWEDVCEDKVEGYLKLTEAVEAQLSDAEDLVKPYYERAGKMMESRNWTELQITVDVEIPAGHYRLFVVYSRRVLKPASYESDDEDLLIQLGYIGNAYVYQGEKIDEEGHRILVPEKEFRVNQELKEAMPNLWFRGCDVHSDSMVLELSVQMHSKGKKALYTGMPYEQTIEKEGFKYHAKVVLAEKPISLPTRMARVIEAIKAADGPEQIYDLSYDFARNIFDGKMLMEGLKFLTHPDTDRIIEAVCKFKGYNPFPSVGYWLDQIHRYYLLDDVNPYDELKDNPKILDAAKRHKMIASKYKH